MNEKELNSNGNTVLTKDAKMFKKLEKENAKLKAELESEKRLTKQIDKHLFDKEKELREAKAEALEEHNIARQNNIDFHNECADHMKLKKSIT